MGGEGSAAQLWNQECKRECMKLILVEANAGFLPKILNSTYLLGWLPAETKNWAHIEVQGNDLHINVRDPGSSLCHPNKLATRAEKKKSTRNSGEGKLIFEVEMNYHFISDK